jgi:hypothetical protein
MELATAEAVNPVEADGVGAAALVQWVRRLVPRSDLMPGEAY